MVNVRIRPRRGQAAAVTAQATPPPAAPAPRSAASAPPPCTAARRPTESSAARTLVRQSSARATPASAQVPRTPSTHLRWSAMAWRCVPCIPAEAGCSSMS